MGDSAEEDAASTRIKGIVTRDMGGPFLPEGRLGSLGVVAIGLH